MLQVPLWRSACGTAHGTLHSALPPPRPSHLNSVFTAPGEMEVTRVSVPTRSCRAAEQEQAGGQEQAGEWEAWGRQESGRHGAGSVAGAGGEQAGKVRRECTCAGHGGTHTESQHHYYLKFEREAPHLSLQTHRVRAWWRSTRCRRCTPRVQQCCRYRKYRHGSCSQMHAACIRRDVKGLPGAMPCLRVVGSQQLLAVPSGKATSLPPAAPMPARHHPILNPPERPTWT